MPDALGGWTRLEEVVALALINTNVADGHAAETAADVPYARLRSEIPFATTAIRTVLEAVAIEADRLAEHYQVHRYDEPGMTWREAINLECMYRDAAPWIRSFIDGTSGIKE